MQRAVELSVQRAGSATFGGARPPSAGASASTFGVCRRTERTVVRYSPPFGQSVSERRGVRAFGSARAHFLSRRCHPLADSPVNESREFARRISGSRPGPRDRSRAGTARVPCVIGLDAVINEATKLRFRKIVDRDVRSVSRCRDALDSNCSTLLFSNPAAREADPSDSRSPIRIPGETRSRIPGTEFRATGIVVASHRAGLTS